MQPEALETKPYGDFSAQLHGRMVAQRVAANTTIEITRRCRCSASIATTTSRWAM
jgi:hypothetical protein